ncbi:MAG: TlpA family protein disulfide reductase [Ardenticatenaceae bacterium]|nr:TlpA family protein disulfide reductase [Ardenticatenaceae bacterium]
MSDIVNPVEQTKSPSRSIVTIFVWVGVIALLALLGWGLMQTKASRPEVGETAPGFNLEFFEGYEWDGKTAASLDDMKGQIVVMNFWASWCVECRVETDELEAAWQKYADQGVVFVGVAYSDVEPNSIEYMKEFDVSFPHAPDLGTRISNEYDITGVPETFIIDQNGEVAHVQIGPISASTLDSVIGQLLAQGG